MIYADHAATAPVRPEVLEAMWPWLAGGFGNPSSRHALGRRAADALTGARASVAGVLGCRPGDVVFTSGGTEADNLAIAGIALANPRGRHLVTTPVEHEAVLATVDALVRLHGFTSTLVGVDAQGLVDPDALAAALRDDTTLVSVQLANNEIGTVQPLAELAELARRAGAFVHSDAVQAAGRLPLGLDALGVDALSLSGHKLGAPKGTGALVVRGRIALEPVLHGGGQERGRRSGTENVAGAVAFATALVLAEAERADAVRRLASVRDRLIARVLAEVPSARLTGAPERRLAGHASFVFEGVAGEAVLQELERRDVLASSGSACAAGRDDPSHVLTALGMPATLAQTALRITLGADADEADADAIAAALHSAVSAIGGIVRT